jgi:SM-20-related protein
MVQPPAALLARGFALAPRTDVPSLRERYARHGRVHLPQLLPAQDAQQLQQALLASTAWRLVFNKGDQLYEIDARQQREIGAPKLAELQAAVQAEGRLGFQYLYRSIRVPDPPRQAPSPEPLLDLLSDFLNSPPFLALMRDITGLSKIDFADSQGTLYQPGHFLNPHDDGVEGKNRLAAYVLGLTPQWQAAWGGQLQFLSAQGHVEEAFVPTFNSLNLLRVPQMHLVSAVTPLAGPQAARLSVTGWLRNRAAL